MVEKLVEISIINSLVVSLILRGYTKLNKNVWGGEDPAVGCPRGRGDGEGGFQAHPAQNLTTVLHFRAIQTKH